MTKAPGASAADLPGALCPIDLVAVGTERYVCPRCRVVYHPGCIKLVGQCQTPGCGAGIAANTTVASMPPPPREARRSGFTAGLAAGVGGVLVVAIGVAITLALVLSGGGDDDDDDDGDTAHSGGAGNTVVLPTATHTLIPTVAQSTPTPTPPSSPTPTPQPLIRVGAQLQVVNTGDCLNVRPQPTRYEKQLTCLTDGTRLSITSGPVFTEGLRWWAVDIPSYRNTSWGGWVAEGPGDGTFWLGPR